jgi:hypothetical protein
MRSGIDAPVLVGDIRVKALLDNQPQQLQNVTNGCAEWLNDPNAAHMGIINRHPTRLPPAPCDERSPTPPNAAPTPRAWETPSRSSH